MWNNYLSDTKWKSFEQIMFDTEILSDLSSQYWIPIEDLEAYTSQQISGLIKCGDPNCPENIEKEFMKKLKELNKKE